MTGCAYPGGVCRCCCHGDGCIGVLAHDGPEVAANRVEVRIGRRCETAEGAQEEEGTMRRTAVSQRHDYSVSYLSQRHLHIPPFLWCKVVTCTDAGTSVTGAGILVANHSVEDGEGLADVVHGFTLVLCRMPVCGRGCVWRRDFEWDNLRFTSSRGSSQVALEFIATAGRKRARYTSKLT
ncbi:hypothetical protein B0H12DRAFT_1109623 [Mycena haematopus]|nr:hypothetical protein B0H12DRAFT_1109623 [Mycena haematopus]